MGRCCGCCDLTRCCCRLAFKSSIISFVVLLVALFIGGDPEIDFWKGLALALQFYHNGNMLYRYICLGTVTHRCFEDTPWQLYTWKKMEEILAKRDPVPVDPVPSIDLPAELREPGAKWEDRERYICTEIEKFGGWGNRPFIVHGLLDGTNVLGDEKAWTLDWFAEHAGEEQMHVINLTVYREDWEDISLCPWKRFNARETQKVKDVVKAMKRKGGAEMYVNFAETFFGDVDLANTKTSGAQTSNYLRQMAGADRVWSLCESKDVPGRSFSGYSGEVFFGRSSKSEKSPVGSPMHAAYMRNLFLQVRGKRIWRMWYPGYSQFFRVQGFMGYLTAFGAHKNWDAVVAPQEQGLSGTYRKHVHALPSFGVDMGPGDLLYVPPWWLHDTRIHDGYSLGISARGQDWPGGSVLKQPILRYLLQWSGWDAMIFDLFQVAPYVYGGPASGRLTGVVERRQHGPKSKR